jgi:hypothetical protein
MRELSVSTQTTPVELADLFNGLLPDDEVAGRPGADGAVVLYVCSDRRSPLRHASSPAAIAARVAIDVVLQHVEGMPGADALVGQVREQLDGESAARVAWLAPPLTLLAKLYCTTTSAMPEATRRSAILAPPACANGDNDADELSLVTFEQRQALESLIDRLMQLPCPSKSPDRH